MDGNAPLSRAAVARMAAYFGHVAALPGGEQEATAADGAYARLEQMVTQNTRAWFGAALDRELGALSCYRPVVEECGRAGGDGKPQPFEWLAGRPLLKCDAADHHLDHGAVWPMDPAYDLAGTAIEWGLTAAGTAALVRRYVEVSGDRLVAGRLPFYRIVYAAALLGQHDFAYHLLVQDRGAVVTQGHHPLIHDLARRHYATALQRALGGAITGIPSRAAAGAADGGEEDPCAC
jgi:hypothetical protein